MKENMKQLEATIEIKNGKLSMVYDPTPGDFGGYPEPTYIISGIPFDDLKSALGIKKNIQLHKALNSLPSSEIFGNEVTRLRNFCDTKGIQYSYKEIS